MGLFFVLINILQDLLMEEGEHVEKCIICLESKPIKGCLKNDKITHIPCTCNAYVHEYCFYKTNNVNKCFD